MSVQKWVKSRKYGLSRTLLVMFGLSSIKIMYKVLREHSRCSIRDTLIRDSSLLVMCQKLFSTLRLRKDDSSDYLLNNLTKLEHIKLLTLTTSFV
jgi:hypothetical protein